MKSLTLSYFMPVPYNLNLHLLCRPEHMHIFTQRTIFQTIMQYLEAHKVRQKHDMTGINTHTMVNHCVNNLTDDSLPAVGKALYITYRCHDPIGNLDHCKIGRPALKLASLICTVLMKMIGCPTQLAQKKSFSYILKPGTKLAKIHRSSVTANSGCA